MEIHWHIVSFFYWFVPDNQGLTAVADARKEQREHPLAPYLVKFVL